MSTREKALAVLNQYGIPYTLEEHDPVYTMEEMEQLPLEGDGSVVKNLFLKDSKGKRHFLVVLMGHKKVDLKLLRGMLGTSGLSFASEARLQEYLGLTKGAVTPLGIVNDDAHCVEVVLDADLEHTTALGIHPNENTATLWISYADLERFVREWGNSLTILTL